MELYRLGETQRQIIRRHEEETQSKTIFGHEEETQRKTVYGHHQDETQRKTVYDQQEETERKTIYGLQEETQRKTIYGHHQDETQRKTVYDQQEETQRKTIYGQQEEDEVRRNASGEEVSVWLRIRAESEPKRYFMLKCLLLGNGLILLLAGMVVLIYFFRPNESGKRGEVISPTTSPEECEDVVVALGEDIEIICKMTNVINGDVRAMYGNLVGATTDDFNCTFSNDKTMVSCRARQKAKCSTYGNVVIRFYDGPADGDEVKFTKYVSLKAPVTSPTASIEQKEDDPTQFFLQCSNTKDCASYNVGFYGRNIAIADSVSCKATFSDSDGYSVACSAYVSSSVIYEFGSGSVLDCQLKHGDEIKKTANLVLPACHDIPFSDEECNANMTTLFDCNNTQDVMNSCNKTCLLANRCFSARVYEIPHNKTSSVCPECSLKWCRETDTLQIDKTGTISFNELCRTNIS